MTIFLQKHKQIKATILEQLSTLAVTAESVGMRSLASEIRTTRIPKIEREQFHLVILGEFNHGKTTFVNALLGADILPTGITPTTAAINHIIWSEKPTARAQLLSEESIPLSPDKISDWVTVSGENVSEVAYVELGYPVELLRENVTLVDTPGVNDLNEQRADVTYGYIPRADAVLFLLDAGQALKDSEREFLASHVLEGSRDRLLFVLGKIDLLNDMERDAVVEYVKDGLGKLIEQPAVFPVSARNWLEGKTDSSGMQPLLDYLTNFLDTDRAQTLLDNALVDASRTTSYLQQNIQLKLHSYDLDLEELQSRVKQVQSQLEASKRSLDALHDRIQSEAKAHKEQVALDLENFRAMFVDAIPKQIDAIDADDVKTYLPGFIEDKFREWAEFEAQKLTQLLEKLAQDVIAVTNENISATSKTLASRLGRADVHVDIHVDSFKYDVGVYAVGALGTTVLLFVSTLAGGLLTLATPVLAIVLKSKIAGDIKQQAKEKAPEAITKAAAIMAPHFDKCVDDFTHRLRNFVTSAGNALYQGISEILDTTVEERQKKTTELDVLRERAEERIQTVAAIQELLTNARQSLWEGNTD